MNIYQPSISNSINRLDDSRVEKHSQKIKSLKDRDLTKLTDKKIREIAEEFESFFVSQVLEYITKGIKTDGIFGGGPAEGIYKSMMNEQYGKTIAARGGFGVGDMLYRDILKLQGVQIKNKNSLSPEDVTRSYEKLTNNQQKHESVQPSNLNISDIAERIKP